MTAIQPIDKAFLEGALEEPIKDFTVGEGCKAGDNVAGSLKSIKITTAAGKEKHLVFKRFPEQLTHENMFVVFMKAFWREHSVYKTVFPDLEKFANSKGVNYVAPAPKYYKGHNDDQHDYLLLEDVRGDGYIMPNKLVSLTLPEVSLIFKEFAKFHAISYAYLRHEGERVFQEKDGYQFLVKDAATYEMIEASFGEILKRFYTTAADVIESRYPEGVQKMRKSLANSGKSDGTMEYLTDLEIFPTICHFDLWSNNMLIKYNEAGDPVGVKFIDFQFTQRGNILSDLHYTLYTSTTPEFRRHHLNTVLNLYFNQFQSTLDDLKVPMPWGFTRGDFIDKYEAGLRSALVRMTFAVPIQLGMITKTEATEEQQTLHSEENIRKMYEESPAALDRIEDIIREMVELKVLK